MAMRSSNPALRENTFENFARNGAFGGAAAQQGTMTIEGTVNKTAILLLLASIAAAFTWSQVLTPGGGAMAYPLAMGAALGGFIVALVTIFKPSASPYTAPVYAVLEGLFLGAFSAVINLRYPGIPAQAVCLTFGTLAVMLFAYKSGVIRVTDKFRLGVVAATGAVALFAILSLVMSAFGNNSIIAFRWGGSPLAIGISLAITALAALNLVLDFDFVEAGARAGAPKFMEWYGGFSLMLTLVWLYLEIVRLLSNLNRR